MNKQLANKLSEILIRSDDGDKFVTLYLNSGAELAGQLISFYEDNGLVVLQNNSLEYFIDAPSIIALMATTTPN